MNREIAFRQMRDTLSFMLFIAIDTKGLKLDGEKETLESIKNICKELFILWGIGYQVLPQEQEELLEKILQMIDTLVED